MFSISLTPQNHVCIHIHMYTYISINIYIYISINIYTNTHTHTPISNSLAIYIVNLGGLVFGGERGEERVALRTTTSNARSKF